MSLRPTLHLVGIFHTIADDRFSHCAFTGKARRFPKMLRAQGWRVIEYANEGSQAEADEQVTLLDRATFEQHFPHHDPRAFFGNMATVGSAGHVAFEERLIPALQERLQPGDIVCHPFGHAHERLTQLFPQADHVETGIGYPTLMANSYRIFESYAWMHWHLGKDQASPRNYDFVIGNYYDPSDWPLGPGDGGYLAFLGRVCSIKGMDVIKAIAERSPLPIKVAGQGDVTPWRHPRLEFVGALTGAERAEFLGGAVACLMPSQFVEPFGGAGVEAQLCGTPLIGPSHGAFSETILEGITGFRCHTLPDWLNAIELAAALPRETVRAEAVRRYSLEACGVQYDRALRAIHGVRLGAGHDWYGSALEPTWPTPAGPESAEAGKIDFDRIEAEEGPFAKRLATWISRLQPASVLDIGCGPGTYVRALRAQGLEATGLDSDPRVAGVEHVERGSLLAMEARQAEAVLCLEVAEHIESALEGAVVQAVASAVAPGGTLIWTAAAPGQGGSGHINCRPRQHWLELLKQEGLERNEALEQQLRDYALSGYHMGWFPQNLLLLQRPAAVAE